MATSNVAIDEGTADKRAATYSISEDAVTKEVQRVSLNDSSGNEIGAGSQVTVSVDVTRAGNTTTYTASPPDNVGSTPSGGYTITGAAAVSGGSGFIHDVVIAFEEDAAIPLQGDIFIFDSSFTEVADNAAFVVSDAEAKTLIGIIPFVLADGGNNGVASVQGVNLAFTTVGSANLRFAVRAKNGYIPTTNSSILTFRFKISRT